jgi:ATP-dependent Clp protease ATP-binding subunit ClpB
MYKIIDLLLAGISKRLEEKQLKLTLTDDARQYVIDHGYDPAFGARPLKRYLQSHVETLAAEKIIRDDPAPGDTLTVDVVNGELAIV